MNNYLNCKYQFLFDTGLYTLIAVLRISIPTYILSCVIIDQKKISISKYLSTK